MSCPNHYIKVLPLTWNIKVLQDHLVAVQSSSFAILLLLHVFSSPHIRPLLQVSSVLLLRRACSIRLPGLSYKPITLSPLEASAYLAQLTFVIQVAIWPQLRVLIFLHLPTSLLLFLPHPAIFFFLFLLTFVSPQFLLAF